MLLVAGAGALGVFPIYHAFTQDVSHDHQGKVTGIAGVAAWAFSPVAHRCSASTLMRRSPFDQGLAVAGCLPLLAFFVLALFWPRTKACNLMTNDRYNRRTFLAGADCCQRCAPSVLTSNVRAAQAQRKKIAFLGTEVRAHSHAQHFLDRMTLGYGWGGKWQKPRVDVASVFIDQFPEKDLARERVKRHNLKLFPTHRRGADAWRQQAGGGRRGDHRRARQVSRRTKRGRGSTRATSGSRKWSRCSRRAAARCPVFNDKHLSTTWERCKEMVDDSKRLEFPFLAGSSLPVTWRLPAIDVPHGAPLVESVCVGYGGVDSYDFHGLETAQCMSERRKGGEVGIKSVHASRGEKMWEHARVGRSQRIRGRLLAAALTRSHTLPVKEGYVEDPISVDWARAHVAGDARVFHRAPRRLSHDDVLDEHPGLQLRRTARR